MDPALQAVIDDQLLANRVMSLATVRPDGWPQVTMVGYVSEGLDLYFVISRLSQKFSNIAREPRVSIAIGSAGSLRGLSMAAKAAEVTDYGEIERLNQLVFARYPEATVFAPEGASVALMRAVPQVISVIDHGQGRGRADLVTLA